MRYALLTLALLGCDGSRLEEPAPAGPLQVGVARVVMPAPVGIGTVGFGGFGLSAEPSPFSDIYPATQHVHGMPEFKVVALSRGEGREVVFVRGDMVGVFQQLRQSVLDEVKERTGRDLDDALVFAGTHTHSGPGRVIDAGGPFDLIADTFLPEHYDRMVTAVADGVEGALNDLAPGRLGHAQVQIPDAHSDRRCEDGLDYKNSRVPLVVLEQEDEVVAVVMAYAIHGTITSIDDLTLSQDVSGAIEQAVEDRFDHPVEALLFNSWGADMAPADPALEMEAGAVIPAKYERMERIGTVVADSVEIGLTELVWEDDPTIDAQTYRFPITRESLGYVDEDEDLFPYDYGGVYCGASREADCDASTTEDGLDEACIGFPEDYPAPNQTLFTAGQLGPLPFVTFPGEPGTLLAERVMAGMSDLDGAEDVLFIGYSQDYTGYSILSEDWWQGGYEASGALWGPHQGDLFSDLAIEAYHRYHLPGHADELVAPAPLPGFSREFDARTPTAPIELGAVLAEVEASYAADAIIAWTVSGSDPWLGTPIVTLQDADGNPVLRPNGVPVRSDDYTFWTSLVPSPSYADVRTAAERQFAWTFRFGATRRVPGWPDLQGSYRLSVELPTDGEPVTVTSEVFEVLAAE